jgi:hypothetical protein
VELIGWQKCGQLEGLTTNFDSLRSVLLGVESLPKTAAENFILYPNPTNTAFQIQPNPALGNYLQVEIYQACGQLVERIEHPQPNIPIFIPNYPQGLYWVRLQTSKGWVQQKLMKY